MIQLHINGVIYVKQYANFYSDKDKKDGLGSNCKECKSRQKAAYEEKIYEDNFDKNVFNENFIDKYSITDLQNIAKTNNLHITKKYGKKQLIATIKEDKKLEPLEKCTIRELRTIAKEKNLNYTFRNSKEDLKTLINKIQQCLFIVKVTEGNNFFFFNSPP